MKQVGCLALVTLIWATAIVGFVFLGYYGHPLLAVILILTTASIQIKVGGDDDD